MLLLLIVRLINQHYCNTANVCLYTYMDMNVFVKVFNDVAAYI